MPTLAAILVGEDPASEIYVRNKQKACERVGIESQLHRLPRESDQEALLELIARLNKSHDVHGILVQLPLPKQIDPVRVLDAVSPWKDVDAFHAENVGRIRRVVRGSFRARLTACSSCCIGVIWRSVASTW